VTVEDFKATGKVSPWDVMPISVSVLVESSDGSRTNKRSDEEPDMGVVITGSYDGNKRMLLGHGPSGAEIRTAAPVDNNGDGSSFSPTDLVAGALGACMTTIMAIMAERDGIDLSGMHFKVEKEMSSAPRRIAKLILEIHLPSRLSDEVRGKLERGARTCPVHHSLFPEIESEPTFFYDID